MLTLISLSPFLLLIAALIKVTSNGTALFTQQRVGKNEVDFTLYKFRTMYSNTCMQCSLTIGKRDIRITPLGYFLRKYKLDELPQLYNVLKNEMSIVGPRPEIRKFVNVYTPVQREVLHIKPGITDYASIWFRKENELLAGQPNAEEYYIAHVIPVKIRLNKIYSHNPTLKNYFTIILKTFVSVWN